MESFLMAVQVVVPMAIMVCIGVMLRITKITDRDTMKKVDKITYNLLMPVLMFYNIYKTDFSQLHDIGYIVYGLICLTIIFAAALFVVPKFIKELPTAAAFGQAIVRPNYIIFGTAVAQSIYGDGNIGLILLMGAVAVPFFNCTSAVVLEAGRHGTASPKKLLIAVVKNPNLVATAMGLLVNLGGIKLPFLIMDVVQDLSGLVTPLSFLSIGVSLSVHISTKKSYLISGVLLRLIIIPAVFLLAGVALGYRGQELCSLMILFAAPTAVSSYPMAVAMDADGEYAGQIVAVTTICCLPTIFLWTLLLNSLQLI